MIKAAILVLNAGSSSIKAALFDSDLTEVLRIEASGIAETEGKLVCAGRVQPCQLPDNAAALDAVLRSLVNEGIALSDLQGVAHRVVHGGPHLTRAERITPAVRDMIAASIPLAPLHNPHHLAAINAIAAQAPDLPQCASFDTAFHASLPEVSYRYALPDDPEHADLRRYGFHGNSYAAMVHALSQRPDGVPPRLLAMHLGNGASLCAIHEGKSVATTMGYSPLSGLTMGTRAGEIDAGAVLRLVRDLGLESAETLLYHRAGLLGLSNLSADMRTVSQSETPQARFAIDHFCYWIKRHAGSMIAAMEGLDAVAFTGGIGENARDITDRIQRDLSWAGPFETLVIPAAEELHIAREAQTLLTQGEKGSDV
ncbi:Acetate kinase [Sulfitobacter noctilucae]|uniref:acetate/propionate family kinase n=1 Tax=Sulfitobacter noctilucae TaxID=1342302 RepID=UPI000567F550|nr:acetate kinase [Sulfitobacter noctilucae]KIN65437.1 Acetate kinase [Sulfitobacter noctilucae]